MSGGRGILGATPSSSRIKDWRHNGGAAYPLAPRFLWECLTSRIANGFPTPASSNQRADFAPWAFLDAFPLRGQETYCAVATETQSCEESSGRDAVRSYHGC